MEASTDGARDGVMPKKNTSTTRRFLSVFVFVVAVYAATTTLGSSSGDSNLGTNHDVTMRDLLQTELRRALRRGLQSEETSPPSDVQTAETSPPSDVQTAETSLPSDAESEGTSPPSEVQSEETSVIAGGNRTRRYLQEGTTRFLQEPGNGTRYLQEVVSNGTRYLQEVGGNRTRFLQIDGNRTRNLQEVPAPNGTRYRYLQEVGVGGNGTRYLQEVGGNGTRYLQEVVGNGTRYLQEVGGNGTRYLQVDGTGNNGTRRFLHDVEISMEILYPETIDLKLPSPCHRVDVGMPNSVEWRTRCQEYLNEAYTLKECAGKPEKVPRIYHSVSHHSDQTYHQLATSAQNPSFLRNHLSDDEAADFVKNYCGEEALQAYRCFAPPAYRADLFRFCALYSQGGIYLDEDIFPFVPLHELYSPCATATVGHDFPWSGKKGKQMKILASAPGAPIFQCALHTIIENVRIRAYPESELELTGPQMLQKCFEEHQEDVAVTYHDTRNAEWPFTGMRRGQQILAYEIPMSSKHFWQEGGKDKEDYTDLFKKRLVYKDTCELQ